MTTEEELERKIRRLKREKEEIEKEKKRLELEVRKLKSDLHPSNMFHVCPHCNIQLPVA